MIVETASLKGRIQEFDRLAIRWILRVRHPVFTLFFRGFTYTAWSGVWAVFVVVLATCLWMSWFPYQSALLRSLLHATIAPGVAWVVVTSVKRHWKRRRPFQEYEEKIALTGTEMDDSFPSGHTASAFAYLAVLTLAGHSELSVYVVPWALLIAFSRVYLGVHYPSDTFVGALIGSAVGFVIATF